jgi:hypothetical protein
LLTRCQNLFTGYHATTLLTLGLFTGNRFTPN